MKEIKFFSKNDKGFAVDDIKLTEIEKGQKYKAVINSQILIIAFVKNSIYITTENNTVKYMVKISKPTIDKIRKEIKDGLLSLGFKEGNKKVKTIKDLTNFIASNMEVNAAIINNNVSQYIQLDKDKLENEMIDEIILEMKEENPEEYNDIEGFYAKIRNDKNDKRSDFKDYPYGIYTKSKETGEFTYWGDDLTKEGFEMYVLVPEIDKKNKNKKEIKEYLKNKYGANSIL